MRCKFSKLNICRLIAVIMAITLAAALYVPCVSASGSGSCGSGVNWQYADGTLTISGSGAMNDYYSFDPAPWSIYSEHLRVIVVSSGVTSIGNLAFEGLGQLVSVTLPATVKSIGSRSFANCINLKMITLGGGVESIGESAFECCESLTSIKLPSSLKTLSKKVFYRCYALHSIEIPSSVTKLGTRIFTYCDGLVSATINASVTALPEWMFYDCKALSSVTVSAAVSAVNSKAFYGCDNLKNVYYLGAPTTGVTVDKGIRECFETAPDISFKCSSNTSAQTQSTVTQTKEDNSTVVKEITVVESNNASISTTVTTQTHPSATQKESSVRVDAVVENKEGWGELVEQIKQATEKTNVNTESSVDVSVSYNSKEDINGESLSSLSGKDVKVTVNMNDGSAVKIDCSRLEGEQLANSYKMSYTLVENKTPAETQAQTLGNADSYLLNFVGNTDFDFSPTVYVGSTRSNSCATLYEVKDNGELREVQSAIVDRDGNATFYLQGAYNKSQYIVAIDVLGVDRNMAIIPDDMKDLYGITDEFDMEIQYAPMDREFLGMNIGQFSFAIFGGIALLIVVFGVIMGIFYRKKRLEMMYRLKMQDQAEQE